MSDAAALGLHHITAISGSPRRTVDFYRTVLGLRLVKRTVNFDDPNTWHLYFGDQTGTPGTLLTFFPWPRGTAGRVGTGQAAVIALTVPPQSFGVWIERFVRFGVTHRTPTRRGDELVLEFRDPDGMIFELVSTSAAGAVPGWLGGGVSADAAIRGLHGVTLWVDHERERRMLVTDVLGFRHVASEGSRHRFECGAGGASSYLDLRAVGGFVRGVEGVGTIHQVAWLAISSEAQRELRGRLSDAGLSVTGQLDRRYFSSAYFREPGGVLFELATEAPGFTLDESLRSLATGLRWRAPLMTGRPARPRRTCRQASSIAICHQVTPAPVRCSCCTAPAETRTTCCSSVPFLRQVGACSVRAGPCSSAGCRASSSDSRRASSIWTTSPAAPKTSRASLARRAARTGSTRAASLRLASATARTSRRACC